MFQNPVLKMADILAQKKRHLYLEIVEFDSNSKPFRQSSVNREARSGNHNVLPWVGKHSNAEVQGARTAAA
jgi:hypothetical protein